MWAPLFSPKKLLKLQDLGSLLWLPQFSDRRRTGEASLSTTPPFHSMPNFFLQNTLSDSDAWIFRCRRSSHTSNCVVTWTLTTRLFFCCCLEAAWVAVPVRPRLLHEEEAFGPGRWGEKREGRDEREANKSERASFQIVFGASAFACFSCSACHDDRSPKVESARDFLSSGWVEMMIFRKNRTKKLGKIVSHADRLITDAAFLLTKR